MAEGKKSVLLYCDLIHTIEKMSDEQAGKFFKHYLRYINDKDPKTDDVLIDITFESVKQNLKRDLKKWEARAEKSRENGALGGRPKKEPKKPTGLLKNQTGLKKPVTVKDTVTVTVKDKDIPTVEEFCEYAFSKKSNLCKESLTFKYHAWIDNGWRNGNDKDIKNWKTNLLNTIPHLKVVVGTNKVTIYDPLVEFMKKENEKYKHLNQKK
jgi:hypothetical protein